MTKNLGGHIPFAKKIVYSDLLFSDLLLALLRHYVIN